MPYTALRQITTGTLFPYHAEMAKRGDMETVVLSLPGEDQPQRLPESVAAAVAAEAPAPVPPAIVIEDAVVPIVPVVPVAPVLVPQVQVTEVVAQPVPVVPDVGITMPPMAPPVPEHLGLAASLEQALRV